LADCSAGMAAAWHWDESQVAGRAAQVTLNAEGGLESSEVTPGKTPTQELSDPYVDNFVGALQQAKGVKPLMIITRTDNSNTVVYAANVCGDKAVDAETPIDSFWADIEPKTSEVRPAPALGSALPCPMLCLGLGLCLCLGLHPSPPPPPPGLWLRLGLCTRLSLRLCARLSLCIGRWAAGADARAGGRRACARRAT